jgi:hypothetical protein
LFFFFFFFLFFFFFFFFLLLPLLLLLFLLFLIVFYFLPHDLEYYETLEPEHFITEAKGIYDKFISPTAQFLVSIDMALVNVCGAIGSLCGIFPSHKLAN